MVLVKMARASKPRFHDEECFGPVDPNAPSTTEAGTRHASLQPTGSAALLQSARDHFSQKNVKAGVDDIIMAYESLAQEKAKLATLRNEAFRDLSTVKGWQAAPHPQALRLKRATPSIPLNTKR